MEQPVGGMALKSGSAWPSGAARSGTGSGDSPWLGSLHRPPVPHSGRRACHPNSPTRPARPGTQQTAPAGPIPRWWTGRWSFATESPRRTRRSPQGSGPHPPTRCETPTCRKGWPAGRRAGSSRRLVLRRTHHRLSNRRAIRQFWRVSDTATFPAEGTSPNCGVTHAEACGQCASPPRTHSLFTRLTGWIVRSASRAAGS
jgi:hypothetical protein